MGTNPGAGQNWNGHAGEHQNDGNEFRQFDLDAPPSQRLAEQLCLAQKRCFGSGGHVS